MTDNDKDHKGKAGRMPEMSAARAILSLETPDGARIMAEANRGFYTWREDSFSNQSEVQAWLDRLLLDNGFYDAGQWFQPAWVMRFKAGPGVLVPGGHKVFRGIIQAPYIRRDSWDLNERLRQCGLIGLSSEAYCSLLWSVLRWAQGGFDDVEIRHNAFHVGLIDAFIPPRRWEPIRPERDGLPDRTAILRQPDPGGQSASRADRRSHAANQAPESRG